MANHTVTWTVTPWAIRWRAQIYVDHHPVEKAHFDDYREASRWARAKHAELTAALAQPAPASKETP
jgi:hypothetical protein